MSSTLVPTSGDDIFEIVRMAVEKAKNVLDKQGRFIEARHIFADLDVSDDGLREDVLRRALALLTGLPLCCRIDARGKDCLLVIHPAH